MNKEKQSQIVWWKELLRLQKIVAALLLVCFTVGIVHSDVDLDGIPDADDPYPETPVEAPLIFTPYENEIIYSPNREALLSGVGEVGSRVQLYDDGATTPLSCQEPDGGTVQGNGIVVAKTTGGGSVDSTSLLAAGTVVDQVFYNTQVDSLDDAWRDNSVASWYTEDLDDAIDGVCDYQAGTQPEDRCGTEAFPAKVMVMATDSRVFIFDAQSREFWKSMAVPNITSVAALDGKVFVGTDSSVEVFDFANDDFTKSYTTELPGAVTGMDTVSVGATQYLAVATDLGAVVIDLVADSVWASDITGALIGIGITTSNRVLFATATEAYISDDAVDLIAANNWTSKDLTSQVRFPQGAPGTITAVSSDVIGLTTGVSRVFDDGNGNILVQHVTMASATLPMGLDTQGQWLETDISTAVDVSASGLDLDNIGGVTSSDVELGADTTMFEFGGTSGYLQSQNNTDFSVAGQHLTVGAWVRRPDYGGTGPFEKVITHGEAATAGEWDYWLSAGESFFDYGLEADPYYFGVTTDQGEAAASAFTFAIDTWQLVVGTFDGDAGELKIFVDGVEQDQDIFSLGVNPVSLSGNIATVDKMLRVGWGYGSGHFGGDVAMPFVAAETYTTEQMELLHRYSNGWFAEDVTTTLRGTSDTVTDITCDKAHMECYVLTDDGTVTLIDGNLFSGGVTSEVADVTDASMVTPTYLGNWECTHAFDTSGAYSVTARTYWDNIQTAIQSDPRNFTIFALDEQSLDTPNILAFPSDFVNEEAATVMWTTNETNGDYFVAEIATDVNFLTGVREKVVQGNAARFIALDDNQQYFFRVKHENHAGAASEWSEVVSLTVDASAPEVGEVDNMIGDVSASTNVEFGWETVPFSDMGSGILWYEVEISTDQSFSDLGQVVFDNDRFEFTSVGITGETDKSYYARVRAMDAVGHWSEWFTSTGTTIDTTAPTSVVLTAVSDTAGASVALTWSTATDDESGIDSYDVWQQKDGEAAVLLGTVSPSTRFYEAMGLVDGSEYTFQIVAKNSVGLTSASNPAVTTVDALYIGAPQIIAPHYTNTGSFDLNWVDNNFDPTVDEFVILRDGVEIATVSSMTTSYTDVFAFTSGDVYEYRVRADSSVTPLTGGESAVHRVLADMQDVTPDATVISATPVNGWYNHNFSVFQSGTDAGVLFDPSVSTGSGFGSGTDGAMVEVGGSYTPHNIPVEIATNGSANVLKFELTDLAGNQNILPDMTALNLDKVSPTVELAQNILADAAFEAANGTVSASSLAYLITATDDHSGVDTYELSYRLDLNGDDFFKIEEGDLEWTNWATVNASDALAITEDGRYELRVRVTDLAGNATVSKSLFINVDRIGPNVSADYPTDPIPAKDRVVLEAADVSGSASGFATVYYTTDGSDPKTSTFPVRREGTVVEVDPLINAPGGIFEVRYFAEDAAGNQSETYVATNDPAADADGDGMPDWWEMIYGGDLLPGGNEDGDSLTNLEEFQNKTIPTDDDSDNDGVNDDVEVNTGTDPLNSADHLFYWLTPTEAMVTGDKFTMVGVMTPGAIAEVIDVTNSEVLGLMTADPQGRISMELSLADGAHELMVQFQHPANPLAVIESAPRNIDVQAASVQPIITNLSDGDEVGPTFSRVLVENLTPNAEAELFEILDGVTISLGRGITDGAGNADIWLPRRSEERRIFVMDITSRETTEIVAFEQGIIIGGQVINTDNELLEGVEVTLTDSLGNTVTVLTATDGTYSIFVQVNQSYSVVFSKTDYITHTQAVTTAYDDVVLSITLLRSSDLSTDNAKKGWSGREIGSKEDIIADYWVPTMTYEESLAQVERLNAGIAGQVRKRVIDGEEVFAGYIVGRVGINQYYRPDDQKIFRITSYSDHVQRMHTSAKVGHCIAYEDTVMDFEDVKPKNKWYSVVSKMHSLGQMDLDDERNFRPDDALTWDELLEMTFAVDCRQPDTYSLLRSFDQDGWDNYPLRNTPEARRAYTALDEGWVTLDTDLSKSPTREEVLRLWMNIYAVPVDKDATSTSFTDIDEDSALAPLVVAARKIDLIPAEITFRGDRPLLRKDAAQWYTTFYDAEQGDLIDRSAPLDQFDDMKRLSSYEATKEAQAEGALLQREISEERIKRIMENAVQLSDEELAGNSGFVIRAGESRDEFRERLAVAKESRLAEQEALKAKLDYDKLKEESLANRIEQRVVAESKIKISDKSGFIRRAGESREDFLVRLEAAKSALEEKKVALQTTSEETMKASAPKVVAGPTRATQDAGRIKVDLEEDKMCRIKMQWETSAQYRERCGKQTEDEIQAKKDAYKMSFDRLVKRKGFYEEQQVTNEPDEVTITTPNSKPGESVLKKRRMDVALRRAPSLETETASSGVKTRR